MIKIEFGIIELKKTIELQNLILEELLKEFKKFNKHYVQANPSSEEISNVGEALKGIIEMNNKRE